MVLRIRYPDLTYDYVAAERIDHLIAERQIIMFYRPSEQQGIDIERDPIRQAGRRRYRGKERRAPVSRTP